ncbi:MAG: glycosyltransferase family 9 protein [Lentisphaeria bacterium]|nr:glycosyltransferase family 9 protein [Lentisphaeria bacterium]
MPLRLLVIKPSSFGDIVHIFPALALMREKFPDAELDFVVNPEFAPVLDFSPFPVSRKIIFERRKLSSWRFLPEFLALLRQLRKEEYDFVIDFQGLARSGLLTWLSRGREKVGFANSRERFARIFYKRKIHVSASHAVERYGELVKQLFDIDSELFQPELPVNTDARKELPELPEKYIVLLPGTRWESKRFPADFFSRVCDKIAVKHPDCAFVACGSAGERNCASRIGEKVINLAGRTSFAQLFEILRGASAVIGNDSGPLHAAAALKIPVFGFYGPTDPYLTGPWGKNCHFFFADCECAGCLKRICPDGSYHCWQLDADHVAGTVSEKLKN